LKWLWIGAWAAANFCKVFYIPKLRHRAFASSKRLMRVLGSIVEPPTEFLVGGVANYLHRPSVRPKPISYDRMWSAIALHGAPYEFQRSLAISALGRENLEHLAFMIDSTPKVMGLAIDPDEHLVQMPPPPRK